MTQAVQNDYLHRPHASVQIAAVRDSFSQVHGGDYPDSPLLNQRGTPTVVGVSNTGFATYHESADLQQFGVPSPRGQAVVIRDQRTQHVHQPRDHPKLHLIRPQVFDSTSGLLITQKLQTVPIHQQNQDLQTRNNLIQKFVNKHKLGNQSRISPQSTPASRRLDSSTITSQPDKGSPSKEDRPTAINFFRANDTTTNLADQVAMHNRKLSQNNPALQQDLMGELQKVAPRGGQVRVLPQKRSSKGQYFGRVPNLHGGSLQYDNSTDYTSVQGSYFKTSKRSNFNPELSTNMSVRFRSPIPDRPSPKQAMCQTVPDATRFNQSLGDVKSATLKLNQSPQQMTKKQQMRVQNHLVVKQFHTTTRNQEDIESNAAIVCNCQLYNGPHHHADSILQEDSLSMMTGNASLGVTARKDSSGQLIGEKVSKPVTDREKISARVLDIKNSQEAKQFLLDAESQLLSSPDHVSQNTAMEPKETFNTFSKQQSENNSFQQEPQVVQQLNQVQFTDQSVGGYNPEMIALEAVPYEGSGQLEYVQYLPQFQTQYVTLPVDNSKSVDIGSIKHMLQQKKLEFYKGVRTYYGEKDHCHRHPTKTNLSHTTKVRKGYLLHMTEKRQHAKDIDLLSNKVQKEFFRLDKEADRNLQDRHTWKVKKNETTANLKVGLSAKLQRDRTLLFKQFLSEDKQFRRQYNRNQSQAKKVVIGTQLNQKERVLPAAPKTRANHSIHLSKDRDDILNVKGSPTQAEQRFQTELLYKIAHRQREQRIQLREAEKMVQSSSISLPSNQLHDRKGSSSLEHQSHLLKIQQNFSKRVATSGQMQS